MPTIEYLYKYNPIKYSTFSPYFIFENVWHYNFYFLIMSIL